MLPITAALSQFIGDPDGTTNEVLGRATEVAIAGVPWAVTGLGLIGIGYIAARSGIRWRDERMCRGGRLIEIALPPEVERSSAVSFWTNMHDLLRPRWVRLLHGQPHFSFEMYWNGPELKFQLWVPKVVPQNIIERAISAAWPAALVADADQSAVVPHGHHVTGGELRLKAVEALSIAVSHDVDPLRAVIGAVGELPVDQSAIVQILARPVTGRRTARAMKQALALKCDVLSRRTIGFGRNGVGHLPQSATSGAITKSSSLGWEVAVRYGVGEASGSGLHAMRSLKGRAHGLASAFAVYGDANRFERRRISRPAELLNSRYLRRGDLLSVAELGAVAHLPIDVSIPGVTRAGAKSVTPTAATPRFGKVIGDSEGVTKRPVALSPKDSCFHLHVMGATGSGKSTLLTNLVLDDVAEGRGAIVIDPKGDLVTDIIDRLPVTTAGKVTIIDPDAIGAQATMNVLEVPNIRGGDADLVVENLVGIFARIFGTFWGPRTDDVLRSACLTLMRTGKTSLSEVPLLLSDDDFRAKRLADLSEQPELKLFWDWYGQMSDAQRSQVIGPVMNKLRAFLLRPFVTDIVGATNSSLDMDKVLDGGLLLVRIPKGIVGDETSKLLGSFVVAQVWQAVTARARRSGASRGVASLYVDECQNFLNLPRSFDEMLAEGRGYGLSLVLAHQHLGQLSKELREAISANARNKVFLNTSPEDGRHLQRHVEPQLSAHDLSNLGRYQAAVRLVVDGLDQSPCTVVMRPAPDADSEQGSLLREAVRKRAKAMRKATEVDTAPKTQTSVGPRVGNTPGKTPGKTVGSLGVSDPESGVVPASGVAGSEMTEADFHGDK
jgi:hypothetical protein